MWLAQIYISPFDSLAFQLKKQRVINEFLDRLIIHIKVKVVVNERKWKSKFAKEIVYFLVAFAITPSTFKKFNLQVVKGLWIEVSLQGVVVVFETHQIVYSIHMDFSVIRVLEVFRATLSNCNIFLCFNGLITNCIIW